MPQSKYETFSELNKPPSKFGKMLMLFTGVILMAGATLGILTEIDGIDNFSSEPKTQEDNNITNIEAVAAFAGALLTAGALVLDQKQS